MHEDCTTVNGDFFNEQLKKRVWEKGLIIPGESPELYRMDACGAVMSYKQYHNSESTEGWEIDHIKPVDAGGTDDLGNLQPLQWMNNRYKRDMYPDWNSTVPDVHRMHA